METKTKTYEVIGFTDWRGVIQPIGSKRAFPVREDGTTIVENHKCWKEVDAEPTPAPAQNATPEAQKLDPDLVAQEDNKAKEEAGNVGPAMTSAHIPVEEDSDVVAQEDGEPEAESEASQEVESLT